MIFPNFDATDGFPPLYSMGVSILYDYNSIVPFQPVYIEQHIDIYENEFYKKAGKTPVISGYVHQTIKAYVLRLVSTLKVRSMKLYKYHKLCLYPYNSPQSYFEKDWLYLMPGVERQLTRDNGVIRMTIRVFLIKSDSYD